MIIGPHSYYKLNTGDQPCTDYKPCPDDMSDLFGEGYPQAHCCPRCEGEDACRFFCINCHRDHHSDGWESCEPTEYYRAKYMQPKPEINTEEQAQNDNDA